RGAAPWARASAARSSMNAVVDGFLVRRSRTSGSVTQTYPAIANAAAGIAARTRRAVFNSGVDALALISLLRERAFQRAAQQHDEARLGTRAHQADAPDLAGERAEAGADLDVVLVEQMLAHRGFVDAVGHAHRVQRPQALAFARQQAKPERLELLQQQAM